MKGQIVSFCKREFTRDFMVYANGTARELDKANYIPDWDSFVRELKAKHFVEV